MAARTTGRSPCTPIAALPSVTRRWVSTTAGAPPSTNSSSSCREGSGGGRIPDSEDLLVGRLRARRTRVKAGSCSRDRGAPMIPPPQARGPLSEWLLSPSRRRARTKLPKPTVGTGFGEDLQLALYIAYESH